MSTSFLVSDVFEVTNINREGKKFDKVSRIEATSQAFSMNLQIDINVDVYPMSAEDRFTFALAETLRKDGRKDSGFFDQEKYASHADDFEYVMHGKVFKYLQETKTGKEPTVSVFVSCGGLLMGLTGDAAQLDCLHLDDRVFLLIRKIPTK